MIEKEYIFIIIPDIIQNILNNFEKNSINIAIHTNK
jgi:hypothetical protein